MKPTSLIVFGFTGDLTKRKLLPALYNLEKQDLLDDHFQIIGVTRKPVDISQLKDQLEEFIEDCERPVLDRVCDRIKLADADISRAEDFPKLRDQIEDLLPGSCELKMFYFAVPSGLFEDVVNNMVEVGIHKCGESVESRLLIEKPFGHDLESAQKLLGTIEEHFGKESIYPIDHYLAKDTAQNILFFRFHNPIIQAAWNSGTIKAVQVSALEYIDIQGRANFYEQTGALRDMLQGHLMQVLSLVTMDEPVTLAAENVREHRKQLISRIKPIKPEDVDMSAVRAQYKGYREQVENADSTTETFAALRLEVEGARWKNVPIFLRAGKAMNTKITEVDIIFESHEAHYEDSVLTLRLQPSEGIALTFVTKKPGYQSETETITLDYCYDVNPSNFVDAYDRIIHDALKGDQSVFPGNEEIIASWRVIQAVLDHWRDSREGMGEYEQGAKSVDVADQLIGRDGIEWVNHEAWVCAPRFTRPEKN